MAALFLQRSKTPGKQEILCSKQSHVRPLQKPRVAIGGVCLALGEWHLSEGESWVAAVGDWHHFERGALSEGWTIQELVLQANETRPWFCCRSLPQGPYSFVRSAVTKRHRLGGLTHRSLFSHCSGS